MLRIALNNRQSRALLTLLATVATGDSTCVDITRRDEDLVRVFVTVWRNGDPCTWAIEVDGETREAN